MNRGLTCLYTSRRTHFIQCKFWNQDEDDYVSNNEILYNTAPTGRFSATEMNAYSNEDSIIGNNFMFDTNSITLKTTDDISKMKVNDKVWTDDDRFWVVTNIQYNIAKKQRNYTKMKYCCAEYIISLRG